MLQAISRGLFRRSRVNWVSLPLLFCALACAVMLEARSLFWRQWRHQGICVSTDGCNDTPVNRAHHARMCRGRSPCKPCLTARPSGRKRSDNWSPPKRRRVQDQVCISTPHSMTPAHLPEFRQPSTFGIAFMRTSSNSQCVPMQRTGTDAFWGVTVSLQLPA